MLGWVATTSHLRLPTLNVGDSARATAVPSAKATICPGITRRTPRWKKRRAVISREGGAVRAARNADVDRVEKGCGTADPCSSPFHRR